MPGRRRSVRWRPVRAWRRGRSRGLRHGCHSGAAGHVAAGQRISVAAASHACDPARCVSRSTPPSAYSRHGVGCRRIRQPTTGSSPSRRGYGTGRRDPNPISDSGNHGRRASPVGPARPCGPAQAWARSAPARLAATTTWATRRCGSKRRRSGSIPIAIAALGRSGGVAIGAAIQERPVSPSSTSKA